ncbi:hypothetical protein [Nocardia seriolae]|uniref:hypothetical protein n=1 Tax=Nocardia seriolae TaxID=37332 RepID=UPI001314A5B4|nr:hypothetical protein [Nocardia seriolae]QOW31260.1 hypothetical protein IMZ23_24535 [Nocardia seriolae]QUN18875.1 hypothetical protein KEC46_05625 [Nocardia seriolae]WKY51582.1 hypothetical protein Q5P07_32420 [Nocardia seriolae]WNJ58284.1 hypothetical protein RMO66_33770 [Nocardia seriolae]
MTDIRATSKARNGVCIAASLFEGDSSCKTKSIQRSVDYRIVRGDISFRVVQYR